MENEKEAIREFELSKVDVFLFDLDYTRVEGYNLVKYIVSKNFKKHYKSVVGITQDQKKFKELQNNPFMYHVFLKPVTLKEVYEMLENAVSEKLLHGDEQAIKERIKDQLDLLSFNFSYNGTKFLSEVVYEIYTHRNKFHENLSKDIYPIIAEKYGKTVNTVKCDISHATKLMYYDCKEEVIMKYFNYKFPVKPRVKEVIFTIVNNI